MYDSTCKSHIRLGLTLRCGHKFLIRMVLQDIPEPKAWRSCRNEETQTKCPKTKKIFSLCETLCFTSPKSLCDFHISLVRHVLKMPMPFYFAVDAVDAVDAALKSLGQKCGSGHLQPFFPQGRPRVWKPWLVSTICKIWIALKCLLARLNSSTFSRFLDLASLVLKRIN